MNERCNSCPHHFTTGVMRRCYLITIRAPEKLDLTNAASYKPCCEITCGECIAARDKYRAEKHCEPPLLKVTCSVCSGQRPHISPKYTVEEI